MGDQQLSIKMSSIFEYASQNQVHQYFNPFDSVNYFKRFPVMKLHKKSMSFPVIMSVAIVWPSQ